MNGSMAKLARHLRGKEENVGSSPTGASITLTLERPVGGLRVVERKARPPY